MAGLLITKQPKPIPPKPANVSLNDRVRGLLSSVAKNAGNVAQKGANAVGNIRFYPQLGEHSPQVKDALKFGQEAFIQAPAQFGAGVALSARNAVTGEKNSFYQPDNPVSKFLLGDNPVYNLEGQAAQFSREAQKLGVPSSVADKFSTPAILGLGLLNFTGAGGAEKSTLEKTAQKTISYLAKEKNLSSEEVKAAQTMLSDISKVKDNYVQRIVDRFGTPNVISADEAKHVIPGFNGINSGEFHPASSALTKALYEEKLAANKGTGNNTVLFMSGGTGSGKTTAIRNALQGGIKDYPVIYDTNLTGKNASDKIRQALENGYNVRVAYVQRDPVTAFKEGVLPRVRTEGRLVGIEQHITRHAEAFNRLEQLKKEFGDKLDVQYIDNTGGAGTARAVPLDNLPKFDYNENTLRSKLHEELSQAIQKQQITPEEANAIRTEGVGKGTSIQPQPQPQSGQTSLIGNGANIPPSNLPEDTVFPRQTQQLNVNRLDLSVPQKAHVASLESNDIRQKLGDKTIKDIASNAGLDTKTHTIDEQAQKIAEHLNVRRDIVTLENQLQTLQKSGKATPKELEDITKQIADQSKVSRTQGTFIARQLAARRIIANELDTPMQRVFKLLDNAGVNPDKYLKDAAKVDFQNPKDVVDFYSKYVPPKAQDWLDAVRYNSMLSSPLTHIINTTSNIFTSGFVPPIEKTLTGALDFFKSKITGAPRENFAGEGGAYLKGYLSNLQNASNNFADVLAGKKAIKNLDFNYLPLSVRTKGFKHSIAKALEVPTSFLEAADQFFGALTEGGAKKALEYKIAKGGKFLGDAKDISSDESAYRLFRSPLMRPGQGHLLDAVDTIPKAIMQWRRSKNPIVSTVARFTFPFLGTPTNIIKQGFEYSPVGLLTLPGHAKKLEQLSKTIMGTAATLGTSMLLGSGRLSWAQPTDPNQKQAFIDAGIQPYSIKIGDNWYSYQRLPPILGFNVAMTAALEDAYQNKKIDQKGIDMVMNAVMKFGNFWSDQSYFKQMGDLLASVKGDPEAISRSVSNTPQQVIPLRAFSGWLARMTDKYQRKVDYNQDFVNQQVQQLMMQIPGLREKVQARTDTEGNPLLSQHPIINAFSPVAVSTEDKQGKQSYSDFQMAKQLRSEGKQASLILRGKVGTLYNKLKTMTPDEANKQVEQLDDKTYNALKQYAASVNATPETKRVRTLGIESGARSRYIYEKLKNMQTKDQKNKYLDSLGDLVTNDVYDQLQQLLGSK